MSDILISYIKYEVSLLKCPIKRGILTVVHVPDKQKSFGTWVVLKEVVRSKSFAFKYFLFVLHKSGVPQVYLE